MASCRKLLHPDEGNQSNAKTHVPYKVADYKPNQHSHCKMNPTSQIEPKVEPKMGPKMGPNMGPKIGPKFTIPSKLLLVNQYPRSIWVLFGVLFWVPFWVSFWAPFWSPQRALCGQTSNFGSLKHLFLTSNKDQNTFSSSSVSGMSPPRTSRFRANAN